MITISNSAGTVSPSFNPFSRVDKRFNPFIPQIGLLGLGVYHALSNYADNVTRICWPRQSTIANFLGISRKSVNRGIARLVDAGLIEIVQERPGYGHVYRLLDVIGFRSGAEPIGISAGEGSLADAAGEGVTFCPAHPGEDVTSCPTIELDCFTANYTQEQQPTPALEQPAQPEPAGVVVVSPDIQEIVETVIPEPVQEAIQKTAQAPAAPSETETLAEALPLPKKAAVKLLERAPAAERPAIVETFKIARAKRTIHNPIAYLASLVKACLLGTFTPEDTQQAQRDQEKRRRNAEALARSNAEMERRAMARLGLAPAPTPAPETAPPAPKISPENQAAFRKVRAMLHGGPLSTSPGS